MAKPKKTTEPQLRYFISVDYKDKTYSTKVSASSEKDAELKAMLWAADSFRIPADRAIVRAVLIEQPVQ